MARPAPWLAEHVLGSSELTDVTRIGIVAMTHFSQRYPDPEVFELQARAAGFDGELTIAQDLIRVPLPSRHP